MRKFESLNEVPPDCVVAPTAYWAPRPDAKCVGEFQGQTLFKRADVGQLRTVAEWQALRREVKANEEPLAERGFPEREPVYAEWQTKL
jgi:hypothetical protein